MKKIILILSLLVMSMPTQVPADTSAVASVNGAVITKSDLEAQVNRLIPQTSYHGNVSEETKSGLRDKALQELIVRELQFQDAVAKGIKPDKKQVKKQMSSIRDRYRSKKDYLAALKQAGMNEAGLKAEVEKHQLVEAVIVKTVQEPSIVTDAGLKEYFDKNTTKYKQPESVRLRLISTKDENKAKEAMKLLRAGEDFGDIAARMSEDNYRIKGGDIGYIHRGRVLQEIEDVAFQLKKGEKSDLIKGSDNWFIIQVEDKQPERQLSFDEIKGKLKKELEAKNSQERMEKWLADLKAKAKIELSEAEKK